MSQWMRMLLRIIRMGRMHFIFPGLLLFVFGALLAVLSGAPLSWSRLALGYLVFMPAHLGMNYSNDYFDAEADRHSEPTLFTGGSHVLVDYPELKPVAGAIALLLAALSLMLGILFVRHYFFSPWLLAYLVFGNLVGWFYAAPPVRLSYRGWGEISTMLSLGLLIPGMGYLVMKERLDATLALVAIPMVLYGLAFIISVEIPDMEADRRAAKWNFVARSGRETGFMVIATALALAMLTFLALSTFRLSLPLDTRILGFASLLPLLPGLAGFARRRARRGEATRIVNTLLVTLIVFLMLADAYLVALVKG